jgi:hypothetical protein
MMGRGVDKFGVLICQCVIGYGKEVIVFCSSIVINTVIVTAGNFEP